MKYLMISLIFFFILASCGTESDPDVEPPTSQPQPQPEPVADTRAQYTVTLTLSNDSSQIELQFGQHTNPSAQDEQMPPSPPEGTLNAHFTKNNKNYWKDFRSEDSEAEEWDFTFQTGANGPFTLKWNVQTTKFSGSLTLVDTGDDSSVEMGGTGEIELPESAKGNLLFRYQLEE